MDYPLFDFFAASIVMGFGIGADVAIATMLKSEQLLSKKAILVWVVGVSFTHTVFPMIGYLFTYFSVQSLPILTPVVGVIAFSFIARFLYVELSDYQVDSDKDVFQKDVFQKDVFQKEVGSKSSPPKDDRHLMMSIGLILAVSWDALWSGPAKSAQVIGWPELLVWSSFIFVGIVVALCALSGLLVSRTKIFALTNSEYQFGQYIGLVIQYTIIGYFGLLALLRYTFDINVYWWQVLLACLIMVLFTLEHLNVRNKMEPVK